MTWTDGSSLLNDVNFNTEIRNSYLLLLNPPMASVRRSTSQSIPTGSSTWTAVSFDTLNFDTEDPSTPFYSSANPTRLTITTPGYYECVFSTELAPGGGTWFTAAFRVNGTSVYAGSTVCNNGTTTGTLAVSPVNLIPMNASDYIEVVCRHGYTVAVNINQTYYMPAFQITRRRGI